MSDITALSASALADAVASGELSSVEITSAHLERIEATESTVGSFLARSENALDVAAQSDARRKAGAARSALDGIPIAIKDVLCTTDMVTTAGSRILEGWTPPYDATVVRKLREAGLVPLGKTNMDEFAMGLLHRALGLSRHQEPLGHISGAGRVRWWLRSGCGGQTGPCGYWERYWRFNSPTRRLYRNCRG